MASTYVPYTAMSNFPPKTPDRISPKPECSPLKNKAYGSRAFGTDHVDASVNKADAYVETAKYFLGMMPVELFLDAFLPRSHEQQDVAVRPDFSRVARSEIGAPHDKEKGMEGPLVEALNSMGLDGLYFKVTANKCDTSWVVNLATDITVYSDEGINSTNFSRMELFAELKKEASMDPFIDPKDGDLQDHDIIKDTVVAQQNVGQATAYAIAMMGSRYRTHCFSVYIAGDTARFIRWDRSGAVVSKSFDYTDPRIPHLAEFFTRFQHLTPTQRGIDETVQELDPKIECEARDGLRPQKNNGESDKDYQLRLKMFNDAPLYNYTVPTLDDKNRLIKKHYVGLFSSRWACSLVGRSSRGTPVYDIGAGKVRYLKDTWRVDAPDLAPEHKVYAVMHEKRVRRIMTINAAGDVRLLSDDTDARAVHVDITGIRTNSDVSVPTSPTTSSQPEQASSPEDADTSNSVPKQCSSGVKQNEQSEEHIEPSRDPKKINTVHTTITDKLLEEDWVCGNKDELRKKFTSYIHYRLVLEEVGRDLTSFGSTKEMLRGIADALLAHTDAYFVAQILHRDISPSNILIMDDGSGRLIDWDLCSPAGQLKPRRAGRTGTWQFVSGLLLKKPSTKFHEYTDDLESFLHVLTYLVVRYSESSLKQNELQEFLKMFDEESDEPNGKHTSECTGGKLKSRTLAGRSEYIRDVCFSSRPGLYKLIDEFADLFHPLYLLERHRTEEHRRRIESLCTRAGGGDHIRRMICNLLENSSSWPTDDRACKILFDNLKIKEARALATQRQSSKRKAQDYTPSQGTTFASSFTSSAQPLHRENDVERSRRMRVSKYGEE